MTTHLDAAAGPRAEGGAVSPSAAGPNAVRDRGEVWACVCVALLVSAHFVFLMAFFEPAISTPDANGYFAQARHIVAERRTSFTTESDVQFIPPHWLRADSDRYFSKYPPGLPLMAAGLYACFGARAALLLEPVLASLTLVAIFLLCRSWLGARWGVVAAILMAVNPIANEQALFAFAHTAVAFFLTWGVVLVDRWRRTGAAWPLLFAGLCFGVIPTIRYAEGLFCPALALFVLLHRRGVGRGRRAVFLAAGGVIAPIAALAIRNHFAFGAFWKTGYALTHEQTGFGWRYFTANALPYLEQLLGHGGGLAFGLGVVGIAAMCASRPAWKRGVLLGAIAVPSTLLYMAYYWSADGMSMRFLEPTLFVYVVAGLWLLRAASGDRRSAAVAGSVALLAVTACWGVPQSVTSLRRLQRSGSTLAEIAQLVEERVAPGSIVIADRSIQQHLDFLGRWRLVDASILTPRGTAARPPGPAPAADGAPNPRPPRAMRERLARFQGPSESQRWTAFAEEVWHWAGDRRRVYWLIEPQRRARLKARFDPGDRLETVARIDPSADAAPEQDFPGGIGPGRRRGGGPPRLRPPERRRPFARRRGPPGGMMGLRPGRPLLLVEWTRTVPG